MLMEQMEAAQRDFLEAQRRWNADQKGDFMLLEVCSNAEQRPLAAFFEGWMANMRLKNPRLFALPQGACRTRQPTKVLLCLYIRQARLG